MFLPLPMLALLAAFAQPPQANGEVHARIRQLEAEWTSAVLTKDRATLERIMSPEFTLSMAEKPELHLPRDPWLANLGRMKLDDYRVVVEDVQIFGSVAVAQVRGRWTVSMGGPANTEPLSFVTPGFVAVEHGRS